MNYSCGIDVGTKNLGICFVSSDRVIGYRGELNKIYRYEAEKLICVLEANGKTDHVNLIQILSMIPEFEKTFKVSIEKQMAQHNAEILRIDGIIYGFLTGRYPNIAVDYISPQKRKSEAEKILSLYPEAQNVKLPKRTFREQKLPGMKITGYFYPEFYQYIKDEIDDNKLDDICDSLIFAIINTQFMPCCCTAEKMCAVCDK